MRKSKIIVFCAILLLFCSTLIFKVSNNLNANGTTSSVSFESFSSEVLNLLRSNSLEDDADKIFYIDTDLTKVNNNLMVDSDTFQRITNNNVKLGVRSCEISRENISVTISSGDNIILVNNKDIVVTTKEPKIQDNKLYFPLQDVAKSLGYEILETQDKIILSSPYQTKRLIVSSSYSLDSMGAIKTVEGYKNLHIYEYKTEEDCKKALDYYSLLNIVDWVEVDKVYSIEDNYSATKNYNEISNTDSKSDLINNNNSTINNAYNAGNNLVTNDNGIEKNRNVLNERLVINSSKNSKSTYTTWGADALGVSEYTDYLLTLDNLNQVIVAVLDTGLDSDHEWFNGRISNGGRNFSTSTSSTNFEYEDAEGHGTHVAGTIVDLTLDNVKILPIKVMNDNGYGSTSNIILGLQYVTNLKTGEVVIDGIDTSYFKNIVAINLSLGGASSVGSSSYNSYNSAITNAYNNGIISVVAAGNDGVDATNTSPANVSCAITVSAVGKAGDNSYYKPYWSNWGQYIDVCAPGEGIVSAKVGGGTISLDGTSMASPHIAGVVALLYSSGEFPYTASGALNVTNIIKNNAVDLGTIGWDDYYGEGLAYVSYAYADILSDNVIFSDTEIDHQNGFNLTLSYLVSGSIIYYTCDGSTPTRENGTIYSNPIPINKTQIIQARAFVINDNDEITSFSKVSSQIYIINNLDIDNAYTVSSNGELISYNGLFNNVIVPKEYNNITITSIGERAFIVANPEYVTLPETVTTIGRYGFYGCSNLKKVSGKGVIEIGMYAFYFSDNLLFLTDNEFPNLITIDKYAFSNCVSLQNISLTNVILVDYFAFCNNVVTPENLTSINLPNATIIGDCAFYGSSNLTSVLLPKVEVIGNKTFLDCNLQTLNLPSVKYIGSQCFEGNSNLITASMPELILVGGQCFYNCKNLSSIEIPKVKHIASIGFASTGLTSIDLPQVETIGVEAFHNCTKLTNFNAPKLKTVKAEAFFNCTSLESVNLPSVINIEREAFYNITSVTSVTLSPYVEYISSVAFNRFKESCVFYIYGDTPAKEFVINFKTTNGATIKYEEIDGNLSEFNYEIIDGEVYIKGVNSQNLIEVVMPSYIENLPVTKICSNAFANCELLKSLTLTNVETIESGAFSSCTNLTYVNASKIKSIGANAFSSCISLLEVDIQNASSIGASAFYNCPSLKQIKLGKNVSSIGLKAFGYVNNSVDKTFALIGYEGIAENYATSNNISFHNIFNNLSSFYFNYYNNNGKTEISISLVDSYTMGGVVIPSSYTSGGITYNITKIGDNAFEGCVLITDVKLPSSITTLGSSAFYNCTNLREINLDYVTSIGSQCFSRCENLQSVSISNVKKISPQTFAYCYNLKFVELSQTEIIGDRAFYFCLGLESVVSPNLQTIEYGGFSNCYKLKNINLNTVITLGTMEVNSNANSAFAGSVFENCYELGGFVYLANIQNMGGQLFDGSSVENIVIGKSFNYYSENYSYRPTDSSITIYGYANTFAQSYANRYRFNFVPIAEFSLINDTELRRTCLENEECNLQVTARGYNLKYQWYSFNGTSGTKLTGETAKTLKIDTSKIGTFNYYLEVTNWDDNILSSPTYTITVLPSYQIILTYNESRGSVTSNGQDRVSAGGDVTYTILANTGCYVLSIKVDGITLSETEMQNAIDNGYKFTNVYGDHTLEVEFGITIYKILVTYGENGAVYDENNVLIASGTMVDVEYNSRPIFIFRGDTNYHAEQVLIDGEDKGKQDNYRFSLVTENHTLNVNFEINKYRITLIHNNYGSVQSAQSLTEIYDGEDRTFTIAVEEGYYIESVKCNGETLQINEDNTFVVSDIHEDINLVVNFKEINPTNKLPISATQIILFVGITVGILIIILAPILMFKKRRN